MAANLVDLWVVWLVVQMVALSAAQLVDLLVFELVEY
jgi:hypothetical protein